MSLALISVDIKGRRFNLNVALSNRFSGVGQVWKMCKKALIFSGVD